MFYGVEQFVKTPVRTSKRDIIPYTYYRAATTLLDGHANKEIFIPQEFVHDLEKLVRNHHEWISYDPPIIIYDTVDTGTCLIHVKVRRVICRSRIVC